MQPKSIANSNKTNGPRKNQTKLLAIREEMTQETFRIAFKDVASKS
jgi:hypothetical protein